MTPDPLKLGYQLTLVNESDPVTTITAISHMLEAITEYSETYNVTPHYKTLRLEATPDEATGLVTARLSILATRPVTMIKPDPATDW